MFEKIYACLLRLFPSGFRRHYEEESLQLVRDRLRDERGFFSRLRLGFDLIVDIFGALPQVYRNSYAEATPAVLLTSQLDGVPSFRGLQEEPIRRGTIFLASVLSLTAVLAVFTYVVEPSTPYHPDARVGRLSPIEAVLEHLNGPISPVSEGSVHSDAPLPTSVDTAHLKAQQTIATASAHTPSSPAAIPAALTPGMPVFVQSQPATFGNFSGRWTSSLGSVSGIADIPREFDFTQDGETLTGTARADSGAQYPMIHGLVGSDSLRLEVKNGSERFLFDMKVEGRQLRGTLSIVSAEDMRTTQVWFERAR